MRYRLDMTLRQAEGSLLRVLGTTQRRGYQTVGVNGETSSDGDRWYVSDFLRHAREAAARWVSRPGGYILGEWERLAPRERRQQHRGEDADDRDDDEQFDERERTTA